MSGERWKRESCQSSVILPDGRSDVAAPPVVNDTFHLCHLLRHNRRHYQALGSKNCSLDRNGWVLMASAVVAVVYYIVILVEVVIVVLSWLVRGW